MKRGAKEDREEKIGRKSNTMVIKTMGVAENATRFNG
jgi:hypothetical protein